MPGNESRVTAVAGHDAAGKSSAIHATECTTEDNRSTPTYQVFAQHREQALWRTFQLAVEVDLIKRSPESKLRRDRDWQEWREIYVGSP